MKKNDLTKYNCELDKMELVLKSFQDILVESHTSILTDNQRIRVLSDFITNINQFYERYLPYLLSERMLYYACTEYLFRHLNSFILGLSSEEKCSQSEVKKVVKARLNFGFEKTLILKYIDFDDLLFKFSRQSSSDDAQFHNHLIQFFLLILQVICHQSGKHFLSHQILFDVASSMMVLAGIETLPAKGVSGNQVLRQYLERKGVSVDNEVRQLLYPQLNDRRKMMALFSLVLCLCVVAVAPSKAYLGLIPLAVLALIEVLILQHVHQGVSEWSQGGFLFSLRAQPFKGEDFSLPATSRSDQYYLNPGALDGKHSKHGRRI